MNIGVNARLLLPGVKEGIARYLSETLQRMVRDHPEDTFHLYFDRAYDTQYLYGDNVVPHVVAPQARHPLLWRLWFDVMLPRRFRKDKIDIFFSPDGYVSLTSKVLTVMVSHDLAFEHFNDHNYKHHLRYLRKYAPLFHQRADSIIAVSQATANDIKSTYGIPSDKIVVAGNSTSLKRSDQEDKSLTHGEDYFVYIGSLNPRKNVVRLIAAFDQYKTKSEHHTKLLIIGKLAWKSQPIQRAITEARFASDIIHIQNTDKSISILLSNAIALIYPSLFEGFGIPILEGFAVEVPVITSNVSSMVEVAGDAALLIDPNSVQSITEGMLSIVNNPTLRDDLVTKGKKRLLNYSWDDTAQTIYNQFKIVSK